MYVGVLRASLGSVCVCVRCNRRRGAGRNWVYMCECVCASAVNQVVIRAYFGALVHMNKRAVKMSVRLLTPQTVIIEPLAIPSLLVHDPGGPAWILHVSADLRDSVE